MVRECNERSSQVRDLMAVESLAAARIPLKPDLEQAWADFGGWWVN